ncbi:unnamed protein product [Rhizoctonia solani]|uniref:C2H2-type domain-containing protein n=1 Tax=Rhizoctonia solani TaxID=456999 RepID=A0A8H3HDH9_9AGAM|nr:unnamed protein product [Rhizoctonia solani]
MHIADSAFPSEIQLGPENPIPQSQIASSSSSVTVEHIPTEARSRGRGQKRGRVEYETPNSIVLEMAKSREIEDDFILEQCRKYRQVLGNKRIKCWCSQVPELKLLAKCKGEYKGKHEWKRGHTIKRGIVCEGCGKRFKRKDTKDVHRKKWCRPEA